MDYYGLFDNEEVPDFLVEDYLSACSLIKGESFLEKENPWNELSLNFFDKNHKFHNGDYLEGSILLKGKFYEQMEFNRRPSRDEWVSRLSRFFNMDEILEEYFV